MARPGQNCKECVFSRWTDRGMWCLFHDWEVSEKLVCDYYMDDVMAPNSPFRDEDPVIIAKYSKLTVKDIFSVILSVIISLAALGLLIAEFLI